MGVRGLSTFIDQNPDLSKSFKLHDSPVIIDGNNLIHVLYFNHRINFMYGGDYKKYADYVRKYLRIFFECNIKPVIIFDGGYEKSDRKLKTIMARSKDRLTQVQYIVRHGSCSGKVLPQMAHEVFTSVLAELNVAFAFCEYEADDQVAALANHYNCPVISNDSDFYIFDIHNGFIYLNSVDTTVNVDLDSDGKEFKFLNCNIYHVDKFVSYFPGMDKSILPLFGTLIGNDIVEPYVFIDFFSKIQLPKYDGKQLNFYSSQKKMIGLLCWLQHNTLNKAVSQVIQCLEKKKQQCIKSLVEDSINGYKSNHCSLSFIIDKKFKDFKAELLLNSRIMTPCGSSLPMDFLVKFHCGDYPPFFVNAIALHRVFLQPQVEDTSLPSSYSCSRYIRQVLYGILLQHSTKDGACENDACLSSIEEYDRQRNNFQKERVEPLFSLEGICRFPKLNELPFLEKKKCQHIIHIVLGVNSDFFSDIPEEWKLLIGCVKYWICSCNSHPSEVFIYAIILNFIYFGLIKCKNLLLNPIHCFNKTSDVNCSCSSVNCTLSNVKESDLKHAGKNLEKYTHKPSFNHGNPLILNIIHSYSQLQACVLYTMFLNKLLGNCFKNPAFHRSFGGIMLYNIAKDISSRSNPELFVSELLGRNSALNLLFTKLYLKIRENVPSDCIFKGYSLHKRKKKSKKVKDLPSEIGSSDSNNKFDILNLDG